MKIAVSAEGPDLQSPVGNRLDTSAYLIIVDAQTMVFEAVPNPAAAGRHATGLQAVVLSISRKVVAVLTGYCSPTAMKYLSDNGIDVLTGFKGTVAEAVKHYKGHVRHTSISRKDQPGSVEPQVDRTTFIQ